MGPSFVIAGAPRAGTTWLYRNLDRHPGVFLTANKEPRYYAVREDERLSFHGPGDESWLRSLVRGRESYEALYAGAAEGQLRGEASSDYLYRAETAATRLRAEAPAARIVLILRDPAQRAYSNWLQHVQYGREPLSFAKALDAEEERIEQGWAWWWHYLRRGLYAGQVERFLDLFPPEQVLILLHEDLRRDPRGVLERACGFLGIEAVTDEGVAERQNQSLVPRSPAHRAVRRLARPAAAASRSLLPGGAHERLQRWFNRRTLGATISAADQARLRRAFAPEVERLAAMTGLDLSSWLDRR